MDELTKRVADDLLDCLAPLEAHVRAMFGGYCVYIDDKVTGLVCDGRVFVKPSPAESTLEEFADLHPAYPGARRSWRLPAEALSDDPDRVIAIFKETAHLLPKPRRKR